MSLYEMRHTFVSLNYATPDPLLKAMVGHGDSMNTRAQYGHAVDGQRELTASIVGSALDAILKKP